MLGLFNKAAGNTGCVTNGLNNMNLYLSHRLHSDDILIVQIFQELHGNMVRREGFSIQPTLLTPSSRGHIRLNNTDPLSEPLIDPNYLGHPDDVNIMLEGKTHIGGPVLY